MKTTRSIVVFMTRMILGVAVLMSIGVGLGAPASSNRSISAMRNSVPTVRIVDGTESNGGKGDRPKKRQVGQVA